MKKLFNLIAWLFGILSTIVLLTLAISIIVHLPSQSSLPTDLFFNKTQIEMSLETVKTLLPMTAGYILFAAPAIKYLKVKNVLWNSSILIGTCLTFAFGVIAVGLWSGVFALLGDAAKGIETKLTDYSFCNYSWNRAIRISSVAHLCFFTSIAWFITTVMLTLNQERFVSEQRKKLSPTKSIAEGEDGH